MFISDTFMIYEAFFIGKNIKTGEKDDDQTRVVS